MNKTELQEIREKIVDGHIPFEVINIHRDSPSVMIERTEVERLTKTLDAIPKLLTEVDRLRHVLENIWLGRYVVEKDEEWDDAVRRIARQAIESKEATP